MASILTDMQRTWLTLLLTASLFVASEARAGEDPGWSYLITHARVVAPGAQKVDAVAVRGALIAELGESEKMTTRCVARCEIIDAHGSVLIPGFHNAHVHLLAAGLSSGEIGPCGEGLRELQAALRDYGKQHPEKTWLIGHCWQAPTVASQLPTRRELDVVEPRRPVVISDRSGHVQWVNSAALRWAGIDARTPEPPGGRILRDAKGEPTGILLERAADLIYRLLPQPSDAELRAAILRGQAQSLAAGFTAMQGGPLSPRLIRIYQQLDRERALVQRAFLWGELTAAEPEFQELVALSRSLPASGRVQITAMKGILDGVLASRTAALLAPYSDRPNDAGVLRIEPAMLQRWVLRANAAGLPVALHAIGDRAVRVALDAYESSARTLRHSLVNRIEHVSLVDPADLPRFARLKVAAVMQPTFMYYPSLAQSPLVAALGLSRLRHAFAWRELHDAGALLAFGTDYPAGSAEDPIEGLYCAIRRTFRSGEAFQPEVPEQRLLPSDALDAYTIGPAQLVGQGGSLGRIAVGYAADFILLEEDPREARVARFEDNTPELIFVAGEPIKGLAWRKRGPAE